MPRGEGEQGEQRHQELQQAGPPWLLHHLERKIFTRLERRWLPKALKSTIIISHPVTITNLCIYFAWSMQLMLCHCIGGEILECGVNFDNSYDGYSCLRSAVYWKVFAFYNKLVHSPLIFTMMSMTVLTIWVDSQWWQWQWWLWRFWPYVQLYNDDNDNVNDEECDHMGSFRSGRLKEVLE